MNLSIIKILFIALFTMILFGCFAYGNHSTINDVSLPNNLDTGYRVIAVDGEKEQRIQHGTFITRIPYVVISQGKHIVTLEYEKASKIDTNTKKIIKVPVNIEGGKRYRFAKTSQSKGIILVELEDEK